MVPCPEIVGVGRIYKRHVKITMQDSLCQMNTTDNKCHNKTSGRFSGESNGVWRLLHKGWGIWTGN